MHRIPVTLLWAFLILPPAAWGQRTPSYIPHYIAASSTLTAAPSSEPSGAVLLFDRETAAPLGRIDFSAPAQIIGTSSHTRTLYVFTNGAQPEIDTVDVAALSVRSVLPLPPGTISAGFVEGAGGVERVLAGNADNRVAIIDPATAATSWIQCASPPRVFVHNPFDRSTYAFTSTRSDLCVITPDFQLGSPIITPVAAGQNLDKLIVVNNGEAGTLLVTTYSGAQYVTFAIDQRNSGVHTYSVSSLDGVFPSLLAPAPAEALYGLVSSGSLNFLQRYRWNYAQDGTQVFMPQLVSPPVVPGAPGVADERYIYVPVSGYCNTVEGPVNCSVGFRYLDAVTLAPREVNGSVVLAQQTSFGLLAARSVSPIVSGIFRFETPVHRHPR